MNGTVAELLLDTDVLVDHLRGARALTLRTPAWYSVITRCELFAGRGTDEQRVRMLLATFTEIDLDRAIAERAGRVRRETAIRTPDAVIAATAIEHDLELVTRNHRDFARVAGLRLRDPATSMD